MTQRFMTQRWLAGALLVCAGAAAQAQSAPASAASAAPSSPAKKELVAKLLKLQQPGIELLAQQLAEQPATQLLQQVGPALQSRVPQDKREAVAKDIQADAKKYADEVVPMVRNRATQLAPSTIGTMLEERFNEDELRQLVGIFESPVNRKFQTMAGEMQQALAAKLVADVRVSVETKVRGLEQSVVKRLNDAAPASPAATAPAPKASSGK